VTLFPYPTLFRSNPPFQSLAMSLSLLVSLSPTLSLSLPLSPLIGFMLFYIPLSFNIQFNLFQNNSHFIVEILTIVVAVIKCW
jgi:hypothetical protein